MKKIKNKIFKKTKRTIIVVATVVAIISGVASIYWGFLDHSIKYSHPLNHDIPAQVRDLATGTEVDKIFRAVPSTDNYVSKMVLIQPGSFWMGTLFGDIGYTLDERRNYVNITKAFLIGNIEVTQKMYTDLIGSNPSISNYKDISLLSDSFPVQGVSWYEVVNFCNALSNKYGFKEAYTINRESVVWNEEANGFRLPTEAEWEYVALAGKEGLYTNTVEVTEVCKYANIADKSQVGKETEGQEMIFPCNDGFVGLAPVASFQPNAWGIYDMLGNVWEWVWDGYAPYTDEIKMDPVGDTLSQTKIVRGGSFAQGIEVSRLKTRLPSPPTLKKSIVGFRIVRQVVY